MLIVKTSEVMRLWLAPSYDRWSEDMRNSHRSVKVVNNRLYSYETIIGYKTHGDNMVMILDLRSKVSVTTTKHLSMLAMVASMQGVKLHYVRPVYKSDLPSNVVYACESGCAYAFPVRRIMEFQGIIPTIYDQSFADRYLTNKGDYGYEV